MAIMDPVREFEAVRNELDRALDSGFRQFRGPRLAFLPGRGPRVYPLVNVYDDGENLYAEALVPGIEPEQLDVTILGNSLIISGEKVGLKDIAAERIHRNERAGGRFVRTVQLPVEIDRDRVDAQYHVGLLRLTLPRAASSKPRRIMIHANGGDAGAGNRQEERR